MKKIQLLTIAAVSTSILGGSIVPAFAAENGHDVQTTGDVSFTPEDENIVTPPVDPEPPVVIDPIDPNDKGPLSILYAPTMTFGTHKITDQERVYKMIAEKQELVDEKGNRTGELVPYVSFAQVVDTRGTSAGWSLTVEASQFKNDSTKNKELTGATIDLLGSELVYTGAKGQEPTIANTNITLKPGETIDLMSAEEGKGALTSSIVWGDQQVINAAFAADKEAAVLNDNITLTVPGVIAKDAVTYTATLDWSLSNTPGKNVQP